jgi:hypothetical protein
MRLNDFIEKNSPSVEAFALNAGLSADAIRKYLRGERTPRRKSITKIIDATQGQVTANDFYDLPQKIGPKKRSRKQ